MFKIFLLTILATGCSDKSQSHLKSENTYMVHGVSVSKSQSWYNDENGILYNVSEPVTLTIKDVNYLEVLSDSNFIESSYKSGFNTFRTKVNLKITLDIQQQNRLVDFVNNCAEEYGLNVILSVNENSDLLRKLIKSTIYYPNISGIDISDVENIEDTAKSILAVNPEIMIFVRNKNAALLDIPKSKLIIL